MCGIAGFLQFKRSVPDTGAVIARMNRRLAHRGPDGEGVYEDGPVVLGHRRLKVIDLEGGRQPMSTPDGRWTVVFNGEIYNFLEIRSRLESEGIRFATRSDTESLLLLLGRNGIQALSELEGMFALAAWDKLTGTLYLATDPFGKKPLYYAPTDEALVFGSEIKALLEHPRVQRRLNTKSLSRYLAFEYVPGPDTMFEGLYKLEAGTFLEIREGVRNLHIYASRNYQLGSHSAESLEGRVDVTLSEAVSKRLVSDVPLGVFLSGGLDSSAVLAHACRIRPGARIKTFNVAFDVPSFDESAWARRVAQHFGTEHIEERLSVRRMLDEHAQILATLDEPMADPSYIPTYVLCRMARKEVTVALGGDGGDELFGGYPTFNAARLGRMLDGMPSGLWRTLAQAAACLPVSHDNLSFDFVLKQFLKGMQYPEPVRQQIWLGAFSVEEMNALRADSQEPMGTEGVFEGLSALKSMKGSWYTALQEFYFRFYLQGDILVKIDRSSMAHGLELRSPLLDDRLVALVLGIPEKVRTRGWATKYLLKTVMKDALPPDVIHRKKKGFGIPISQWIRGELRRDFESILEFQKIKQEGLFNPVYVQNLLQEHIAMKKDHRKKLWSLYVFQRWKANWLDRKGS